MKQVLIKSGRPSVRDIPAPSVEPGTILVRLEKSCISAGTELGGIHASKKPLWKKAIEQPEKIAALRKMIVSQGFVKTSALLRQKTEALHPLGYSAAGKVLSVGAETEGFSPGMRVACVGANSAFHAEFVRIPRNLAVRVPDGVDLEAASTVALGAIALQGIRRVNPAIGETVVVVGLGFIGQIACQILTASGCRVIAMDLDPSRTAMAARLGAAKSVCGSEHDGEAAVQRLTGGHGADAVLITAATSSSALINSAFRICRKKARVVLVGDVGLELKRSEMYAKELDFLISTSYGPGRYDPAYEEKGQDYPFGYVRWTENRNMAEYLNLIAEGKVSIAPLLDRVFAIDDAPEAYEFLESAAPKPMLVLLAYPIDQEPSQARRIELGRAGSPRTGKVGISIVGAGSFAKGVHLPNIAKLSSLYSLRGIMSRTGHNASAIATQFGADYCTTDFEEVLKDKETEAVLISTRHNLHAAMALKALEAGKHVLLEKPLALTWPELSAFRDFLDKSDGGNAPILLTGFNRRFSPFAKAAKTVLAGRTGPMIINYRMNAGHMPADHWVHTREGGGRNLGEACHVYDLFTFLTESRISEIQATSILPSTEYYKRSDNFVATARFEDGSVATLTYTSLGSKDYPKEEMDIYLDGMVISLRDYLRMDFAGVKRKPLAMSSQDKGQEEEIREFALAIRKGGVWPIPFWQQSQATEIALKVEERLHT
jgi:predicted dehydrogenase/threonine dehydrogenase-like Zn-dependent dehydrogenase